MLTVTSISVQNMRIHRQYYVDLRPSVTVIAGPNGSGKTSLLEALYIALQGTSFKGGDNDILRTGAPWYRIDIQLADETKRTVKFDPTRPSGKKQFVVDGKTHYRLGQKQKLPVVLFEPNDLRLLNGSPSRRREYIDRFIGQADPLYLQALKKYERALKQRNNLLKRSTATRDELFVWDVALSEYGAYLIEKRAQVVGEMNGQLGDVYNKIADSSDVVTMRYPYDMTKQKLLAELHAYADKDIILGFTSVGPHRHDIIFEYNYSPALAVASRGEVRSILLALKFIEVAILQSATMQKPIILLDDVFSELDDMRQTHLVQNFKDHQVIITSASGGHNIDEAYIRQI
jgi:DNA replication and repair protein RecF